MGMRGAVQHAAKGATGPVPARALHDPDLAATHSVDLHPHRQLWDGRPGVSRPGIGSERVCPNEWLVLCLWAAAEWCLFDGKPIESNHLSGVPAAGADAFARAVSGAGSLSPASGVSCGGLRYKC